MDNGTNGTIRPLHKTLVRQIRKFLSEETASRPELQVFLQTISNTYYSSDEGRLLVERALDISSKELSEDNLKIEERVKQRTHELHEEQAKLRASIEGLKVGFVLANNQGAIIVQNKALRKILNLGDPATSFDQLQGQLKDYDLVSKSQQARDSGESIITNAVSLDSKVLQIFMGPVIISEDGHNNVIGTVMLLEDVTEAKILERSKDEFFSIASHELRTPLTSIKGNSSMVLDYYKDVLTDDQLREMIEDIHTSSIRLIEIVNDFLDVSRLEQGKVSYTYAPVNLDKLIEAVAYEMKAVLDEKKIYLKVNELTLNTLPPVWADANRLKQVVYNLIGNAAKFTEEGGISVSAELTSDNKFVKVIVSDTGRGMTADSRQLLFHKFQQASSSLLTRDTSRGTGLGLYISKMITENMGGTIRLEYSEEGKGSSFSFSVPVATEEQQASMQPSQTHVETDVVDSIPPANVQG